MALTASQQNILNQVIPAASQSGYGGAAKAGAQGALNEGLLSGGLSPLQYSAAQGIQSNPVLNYQSQLLGQASGAQFPTTNQLALGAGDPLAPGVSSLPRGATSAWPNAARLSAGEAIPIAGPETSAAARVLSSSAPSTAATAANVLEDVAPVVTGAENVVEPVLGATTKIGGIMEKGGKLGNALKFLDNAIPGANLAEAHPGLGLGVAFGGQILGGIADAQNFGGENSNWDQGITGAIKGLGLGGGAALALGMSGPAGWAVAGTAALIGGFLNAQNEGGTTEDRMKKTIAQNTTTINTLAKQFGLSADDTQSLLLQHQATSQLLLNAKDSKGLEAYVDSLSQTLPQQMLALRQQRLDKEAQDKRQLALQSTFAPIFSSIAGRAAQDNQVAYQSALQAADQLQATNPQLASLITANAAQANQSQDAIMAAYAAQMSTVPNQANAAGYYSGQNLINQYTLGSGAQQIQQPGTLSQSQQNQLAQLQILQQAAGQ